MNEPLKLRAGDEEDRKVISACLQDALTRLADMTFLPDEHRFAVVLSRFMWEREDARPAGDAQRVRASLHFDGVDAVQTQGIAQNDPNGLLPLLAVTAELGDEGALINLQFAGRGSGPDQGRAHPGPAQRHGGALAHQSTSGPRPRGGREAGRVGEVNGAEALVIAVPRGRIVPELLPILDRMGVEPEPAFHDPETRQLRFETGERQVSIVRVRSFDVATFVAFGAAQLGVAGNDVLMEFDYPELYAPLDLGVGRCHLAVAEPAEMVADDRPAQWSHIRIATKYPRVTRRHFARRGVQAECIILNGAMELAPGLGLCRRIVDLVSTGETLRANGLVEVERIAEVSSRLVVNRAAFKTRSEQLSAWSGRVREALSAPAEADVPDAPEAIEARDAP